MKTVLIVEDHHDARAMLRGVVEEVFENPGIAEAVTVEQAREHLAANSPDLALLDISLPDGSGIDLIGEVLQKNPAAMVVMSTIHDGSRQLFAALRAGAKGYLLKESSRTSIADALRGVQNNQPPLSPAIANRILGFFHDQQALDDISLTQREHDVLNLLARGLNRKTIAAELNISPHTVAEYIKQVYSKLDVHTSAEASVKAVKLGLLPSGEI